MEESLFITKFAGRLTIIHQFDKLLANKERRRKHSQIKRLILFLSMNPVRLKSSLTDR